MKQIMTVTGELPVSEMGFVQPHEHLLISRGVSAQVNPALCMEDEDKSAAELVRFREAGGGLIVDAQPGGCNRMAEGLHRISESAGVRIVASTGFHKLMFYPEKHWLRELSFGEIADIYREELLVGMYVDADDRNPERQCPYRAGIVKTALDVENLTPRYARLFKAAVRAAMDCEVPLMVHIEQGSDPKLLLDFLTAEGMNTERLIFCHMDRRIEALAYYTDVMERGVTMEFDTVGRFKYHDDEVEMGLIEALFDRGYDRIMCSLDTTAERLKAYNPDGIGLDYLLETFYPELEKRGFGRKQITKLAGENAKRLFA